MVLRVSGLESSRPKGYRTCQRVLEDCFGGHHSVVASFPCLHGHGLVSARLTSLKSV